MKDNGKEKVTGIPSSHSNLCVALSFKCLSRIFVLTTVAVCNCNWSFWFCTKHLISALKMVGHIRFSVSRRRPHLSPFKKDQRENYLLKNFKENLIEGSPPSPQAPSQQCSSFWRLNSMFCEDRKLEIFLVDGSSLLNSQGYKYKPLQFSQVLLLCCKVIDSTDTSVVAVQGWENCRHWRQSRRTCCS